MKKLEWAVVIVLVGSGLYCLTMASTGLTMSGSTSALVNTFLKMCLWTAVPLILLGILFAIYKYNNK